MESLTIRINLKNKEDIYHPFSKDTLNPILASFMYDECLGKPKKTNIEIIISTFFELTNEEQEKIVHLIRKHFSDEQKEDEMKRKFTHSFYILFFLLGILCTILYLNLPKSLLQELTIIFGWIAIWESILYFFVEEQKDNFRRKRYQYLAMADISFIVEKEENLL